MPEIDLLAGYTDPIVGDVYCADETEAFDMAERTGGSPWVEFWKGGVAVIRSPLVRLVMG